MESIYPILMLLLLKSQPKIAEIVFLKSHLAERGFLEILTKETDEVYTCRFGTYVITTTICDYDNRDKICRYGPHL